jgi:hypothetical protein
MDSLRCDFNLAEAHREVNGPVFVSEALNSSMHHYDGEASGAIMRDTVGVRFHFSAFGVRTFGRDKFRGQTFAVDLEWSDVLLAVERFAAAGRPKSAMLQDIFRALASAKGTAPPLQRGAAVTTTKGRL